MTSHPAFSIVSNKTSFSLSDFVNFTNILCAASTRADSKSTKKYSQLKQLFAILGSGGVKDACKHIDEIDPKAEMNGLPIHFDTIFPLFLLKRRNIKSTSSLEIEETHFDREEKDDKQNHLLKNVVLSLSLSNLISTDHIKDLDST